MHRLTEVLQAPTAHAAGWSGDSAHPLNTLVRSINSVAEDGTFPHTLGPYPALLPDADHQVAGGGGGGGDAAATTRGDRTLFIITDNLEVHNATPVLAMKMAAEAGVQLSELEFIEVEVTTEVRTVLE